MNEALRMPMQSSGRETLARLVERHEPALPADLVS
jgi:hypothetical protein